MRIVTYNVGLLDVHAFGAKIFEFSKHTRSRAEKLPSKLVMVSCDLMLIQELYHYHDAARFKDSLGSVFPYSAFSEFSRSKFRLGHGLAIFSKYPMVDCVSVEFESQLIDERWFGPKGFLLVWVDVPLVGRILMANVHTSAGGLFEHPESVKADQCRNAQLGEMCARINEINASAIVAGDLNCGPDVSIGNFSAFLDAGYFRPENMSLFADLGPTWDPRNALNINSPHRTSPAQRIDHVLFSGALVEHLSVSSVKRIMRESVVTDGRSHTLSDHYGLLVDVDFDYNI